MDTQGKVAVITGASRGLGAGLAETFHARGLRLGLCARSDAVLTGAAGVYTERLDVRDAAAVEAFAARVAETLGPIDVWINNAAVLEPVAFVRDLTGEALAGHLAINVLGVLHGTRAFVAHLRASGRPGVLLNVSSGAALKGYAGWGAYCAGKAAVDRLTECVAEEEAGTGLRAHAVAPGVIDTDMQRTIRALPPERFPAVAKFHDLKAREAFNTPAFVAEHLLRIAFDPAARPDDVVCRLPSQVA